PAVEVHRHAGPPAPRPCPRGGRDGLAGGVGVAVTLASGDPLPPGHAELLAALDASARRAGEAVPGDVWDVWLELAGSRLHLRLAGGALAGPITRALGHLR